MVSNQKIDELLKSLDDTVDSLESGLNCNDETRKIVRDWLVSAQLQRALDGVVCTCKIYLPSLDSFVPKCSVCGLPPRQ